MRDKQTVISLTIKAVESMQEKPFTTDQIVNLVLADRPEVKASTIRIGVQRDLQTRGIIKSTGENLGKLKMYKMVPESERVERPPKHYSPVADIVGESIESHPADSFLVSDIFEAVQSIRPITTLATIRVAINERFVKKGLIEIVGKKGKFSVYARCKPKQDHQAAAEDQAAADNAPVDLNALNLSAVDLGAVVIQYIKDLQKRIVLLEVKLNDADVRFRNNDNSWRETIKEKDRTIAKLNQRISAMQSPTSSQNFRLPLDEVARFKLNKKR